jgi:multidrug efflux pump subunit AcrA (membrane-fusion protein)
METTASEFDDASTSEPLTDSPPGSASPSATRRRAWLHRLRRPWVILPLALVLAVGVWWFGFRSSGPSASAASNGEQLVAVTKGPIGSSVSAEGTVAAAQTANLSFTGAGTVTAVNVKAGDTVTAGEVLATIDSAQLVSSVDSAQSGLATAQAKLSDDEASGASADQIAADQTSVTSATDNVTTAQQSLAGASLVATFDGTVAQVNVTVGEHLSSSGSGGTSATGTGTGSGQSSSTLGSASGGGGFGGGGSSPSASGSAASSSSPDIEVISQGQYTVSLSVGSGDIDRVAVGQTATVTVTTSSAAGGRGGFFGQLFGGGAGGAARTGTGGTGGTGGAASGGTGASATGSVTSVSKVASASSGVAGYPVVITFNADANAFYPGATVTGAIATQAKTDVIQVPTRAVSTQNGKSVVTVATTGKLGGPTEARVVTTGVTAGGQTEITSGLKAGEQVVITIPAAFGGGAGRGGTGGFGGGGFGGFGGGAGGTTRTGGAG